MKQPFLGDVKQEMPGWVARIYERQIAEGSQAIYERFVDELTPRLSGVQSVLDVGCGPGHATELLARRLAPAQVIGVDLSPVFVEIARGKRGPLANLTFEAGNAIALAQADGVFDAAVSFLSIKAWPDRERGVREMARVVRPGGLIALFECDPDCSKQAAQNFCALWRMNLGLPGELTARMGRAWYFRRFVARDGARHEDLRGFLGAAGAIEVESSSWSDQPFAFAVGRKKPGASS